MKAEIEREALVYIIIALAVIFIGVYYVTGGSFLDVIKGKNPFAAPEIEVVRYDFSEGYGAEGYTVTVNTLKIDYKDGEQKESVEIYPVLDFGDSPLLDESGKTIKCTFDSDDKKYNCFDETLTFVLKPERIRSFDNLGKKNTPVQLYFFKKTEAIRDYIQQEGSGRATSNLLSTFIDFYIYNLLVGSVDTSTGADALASRYCSAKDADACGKDDNCYFLSTCQTCKTSDNCEDYSEFECAKCKFAKLNNCRWKQTGTIRGEPQFRCGVFAK